MRRFEKANLSAYLNFLLAKYEMYTGAVEVRSRPYYLSIDPSSICQLRCPTCPTGIDNERARAKTGTAIPYRTRRTRMHRDRFDAVLDELGEYLFLVMFYNWGEPLLNAQLPSYIRRAREYDIATEVNTNLSLELDDAFLEELLSSGLDTISASIDGFSQETYERYRSGGRLDLVKRNLERLVRTRDRLGLDTAIEWNFLVFGFNEHEVPAARKYCEALGVRFDTRDAYIDNPDWLPSHRKDEKPMSRSPEWNEPVVWSPVRRDGTGDERQPCGWHYGYSVVNAEGNVSPCCASWNEKDDFGTVTPGATSFAEVWNNDLVRGSRAAFSSRPPGDTTDVETLCTRCPHGAGIQHLYSLFDGSVFVAFHRSFGRSDPLLARAFDLLARVRFGRIYAALVRHAIGVRLMLFVKGKESPRRMVGWSAFFERHLMPGYFAGPAAGTGPASPAGVPEPPGR